MSSPSPSSINLDQARRQIAEAISIGAPAYNSGDISKCAAVYDGTARSILSLLPRNLQSNLQNALDDDVSRDDNSKAWALRRQFDAIVDYQSPMTPRSSGTVLSSTTVVQFEPFTTPRQLPSEPICVMDGVMGGISSGRWSSKTQTFGGTTSLANNGGFSSLRWRFSTVQNWSYAKGIYLRVQHSKPSEHTFRLVLKDSPTCERIRVSNYKVTFSNPDEEEVEPIFIPFSQIGGLEQMGKPVIGAPPFNPSSVTEIGIMAIKPTVVGDFKITIKEWGLYL